MSERSRALSGVVAGVGVFLLDIWPALLIWWAGSSGSVGDLREVRFAGLSLAYAITVAAVAGWLMTRALRLAEASPRLGEWDPWGAYALGLGVHALALTAVPAIMYALLLTDENRSLRDRAWLVGVLWVGGNLLAAVVGVAAARGLLGRGLTERTPSPRP